MRHSWLNGSHLEKWVTIGSNEKRSHLEKWVTFGKMGHIWKNGSHLKKWLTLKKMAQT